MFQQDGVNNQPVKFPFFVYFCTPYFKHCPGRPVFISQPIRIKLLIKSHTVRKSRAETESVDAEGDR